jgi:hypothetical protein
MLLLQPPSSIAENLDGDPKGTMVGKDIPYSSLRRVCTHLDPVDSLDIDTLSGRKIPHARTICACPEQRVTATLTPFWLSPTRT